MATKRNIEDKIEENNEKKIKVENTSTFKFGLDKNDKEKNDKIVENSTFTFGFVNIEKNNEDNENNEEKEDNENSEDTICPECLGEKNECSQLCGRCMRSLTIKSLKW